MFLPWTPPPSFYSIPKPQIFQHFNSWRYYCPNKTEPKTLLLFSNTCWTNVSLNLRSIHVLSFALFLRTKVRHFGNSVPKMYTTQKGLQTSSLFCTLLPLVNICHQFLQYIPFLALFSCVPVSHNKIAQKIKKVSFFKNK